MKTILFLVFGLFLLAQPSYAADETATPPAASAQQPETNSGDIAALKSFGAWYLKNRDHVGGIHQAFEEWLADPAVPESFKQTGLARQQDMENAVNRLAQLRDQATQDAGNLASDLANAASEAKQKAEDSISKWLDEAISGSEKTPK